MRNLKAGRNTTITADWDALTIGGLGNGGGALGGITGLINETSKNAKALKAGTGITLVDDAAYDAITINVPNLPTIQSNIALSAIVLMSILNLFLTVCLPKSKGRYGWALRQLVSL